MTSRTTLTFTPESDIRPTVDAWASANGFKLKEDQEGGLTFQKGTGFLTAPMMVELSGMGAGAGEVTLQAWIRVGTFVRLFALFMIPKEMGCESGGFKLVVPRNILRKAVNKLLAELGQPEIS